MAVAVGEADHLVLDRRAIARAAAGNRAGIDGGAMRVGADDAMGLGRRAGDVAGKLRRGDRLWSARRRIRARSSPCWISSRVPVDRRPVEPRRRAGLQPAEREAGARRGSGPARPRADRRSGRPGVRCSPRWMTPRRNVPVVRTTRPAGERAAVGEFDAGDGAGLGRAIRAASPSTTVRFGVSAISACIARR